MDERDLEEGELETRLVFPRAIGESELGDLIRYFVAQTEETKPESLVSVSLSSTRNMHYGETLRGVRYESLNDVKLGLVI